MAQVVRQEAVLNILQNLRDLDGLKRLFWQELNYEHENRSLSTRGWPDTAKQALAEEPLLLATAGEDSAFHIIYTRLAGDALLRGHERPIVNQLLRENHLYALFVFSNRDQSAWHLLNVKYHEQDSRRQLFRRITVQPGDGLRTAAERVHMLDLSDRSGLAALEIQDRHDRAFDVEHVTKVFYNELANWYFWALRHSRFPNDAPKEADGHDHVSVIRLITRLIFCWFIKEKGLIPDVLFDDGRLDGMLVDFAPRDDRDDSSVFYRAILQNLFFATLNTQMDRRGWARDDQNFMAHSLYRFKKSFRDPGAALELFRNVPFLNGGLFECLDKDLGERAKPRYVRIDGFSRRDDSQPVVPDFLFFGEEREVDLSQDYGNQKFGKVKVRGLIHTLRQYRFTIEENTPLEQEVALDPELAGKIFENLLAAYNPETGATARKQTGSFYTPREIVDYMVDEALAAYLKEGIDEKKLCRLMSWEEGGHGFSDEDADALISRIDGLRALDPAVGSGAFPIGILHKLVHVLGKLDPNNEKWKAKQIAKIDDPVMREDAERLFRENYDNYGRKLYLIENCIYGVDIQPIAVQIAKMRFFISLIVDQKVNPTASNLGVRALPNLETKFVAANTLIGVSRPGQQLLRNVQIDAKEAELRRVRERHFNARTLGTKAKYREQDATLRAEIAALLRTDGWDSQTARNLAAWDPYDQNASAPFFDPEWMFGITSGFDVVIGNPPYGVSFSKTEKDEFLRTFQHQNYQLDSYLLFTEHAFNLLAEGGIVAFIIPNPWLSNLKLEKIRRFIFTRQTVQQIVHYSRKVFDAIVDNEVVVVRKQAPKDNETLIRLVSEVGTSAHFAKQKKWAALDGKPVNVFADPEQEGLIRKMQTGCALLEDLCDLAAGMKPYEVGKGVPRQSKQDVQNRIYDATYQKSKSYRPLLRGRDIDRYVTKWDGTRWIKYGDNLAAPRKREVFDAPEKIVIRQTGDSLIATLDAQQFICMNNMHTIVPRDTTCNLRFVLGLLNSRLLTFYFRWLNPEKGEALAEVKKENVEKVVIKRGTRVDQDTIANLVDRILSAKGTDPPADTSALEREIDERVYRLYGLTEEEIKIVEGTE